MTCQYVYNGEQYSRPEIIKKILDENLHIQGNKLAAEKWLKEKLGDDQVVQWVSTLVDGKAFGQFTKDGTILLSELFEHGTEYHEAFHRVWQTFLTPQERNVIVKELNNVNLDGVRKLYPKLGVEKLKEEYLAEAFRDYVLNDANVSFPEKTQSFFQKLLDLLRKLFGKKPLDMRELFQRINEGYYRNAKVSYPVVLTPMNRIADFDIDESSELVRSVATNFLHKLFKHDDLFQAFVKGRIPREFLNERLYGTRTKSAFAETVQELAAKDLPKAEKMVQNIQPIVKEVIKYLESFKIQLDEWEEAQDDLGHKDSINDKPAFLTDDKSRFSQQIKLLLASIPAPNKSPKLGITINSDWTSLSSKLAKRLAGKAISTTNLFRELESLTEKNPEFKSLLQILGGTNEEFYEKFTQHPNYQSILNGHKILDANGKELPPDKVHPMFEKFSLRQAFHNSFTKHYYEFYNTSIKQNGQIYTYDSNLDSKEKFLTNQYKNKVQADIQKIELYLKENPDSTFGAISNAYRNWKSAGRAVFGNENHLVDFDLHPDNVKGREIVDKITNYFTHKTGLKEANDFDGLYNQFSNWLSQIATTELEYKSEVELGVMNVEGNKVFPVNLHTFQTILLDSLDYYANISDANLEKELNDLLEEGLIVQDDIIEAEKNAEAKYDPKEGRMFKRALVIKARMPFLFNAYTQNSIWLQELLKVGKIPTMTIYDGLSPDNEVDGKSLADLVPTDLFATFMAGLYTKSGYGTTIVYPAFKHSDRSVFYGYKIESGKDVLPINKIEEEFITAYKGYLQDQENLYLAYHRASAQEKEKGLYTYVSHFNPDKKRLLPEVDDNGIKKLFNAQVDLLREKLEYNGNLKIVDGRPVGFSAELWETSDKNTERALKFIVKESFIGFMEQTKLFTGDPGFYSSAANFFKRMNTQSSTGTPATVDKLTNTIVDYMNKVTEVYHGIEYGKIHKKRADGKIREIIGKEVGDYVSPVANVIYQKYLEYGEKLGVANPEKYAQKAKDDYSNINENDGESYVNLFGWREFYTRIEGWNSSLQKMFDIEMRVLNGETSEIFDEIFNEWLPMFVNHYKPSKTLEWYQQNPHKVIELYWNKFLEPFRVIKGQYMGPVYVKNNTGSNIDGDEMSRVFIPGIRKTSYLPLIPSMIKGTNLEKLNKLMLNYGVDMFHMGSGAKVGTNENIDIYDEEGNFVLDKTYVESLDENFNTKYGSELDYRFMKNQVKISGHEKSKIIVATQARKNMLQNFKREDGTWVDEKLAMEYIELHRQVVYRVLDEIDKLLERPRKGTEKNPGFFDAVKQSLKDEPENVFNALEKLEEEGYIEQLPIKNKLENVLFSMIGKKGVKIKATGNAAIQAAVQMFESGARKTVKNGDNSRVVASEELRTYLDKDGNIQEAEIMMPLPQQWIPKLLKHYGTHDLFKAIETLNSELKDKWKNNVTFKGLRIPNQQVSSNDIFVVKKFFMPTVSNMVVVPADIVVKTGSDFDVDKMNLYMPNLDNNFEYISPKGDPSQMSIEELENRLIQVEREILLHEDNFYQTLATIDDKLLKKDILDDVLTSLKRSYEAFPNESILRAIENIEDFIFKGKKKGEKDTFDSQFFDMLNIPKQVQIKVNAVDSKIGVGVVATEITWHTLSQLAGVKVHEEFEIKVDGRTILTKVFSIGEDKYALDSVYDTEGKLITENLSIVLTSQVDSAKADYAPRININKDTLPVLTYMLRRGESLRNTMFFLNQPIIHEYLRRANVNDSLLYRALDRKGFNKEDNNNLRQKSEDILADTKKAVPNKIVEGLGYKENLEQAANQHEMLQRFFDIKEQGNVMLNLKKNSPDTNAPKNMAELENMLKAEQDAYDAGLLMDAEKVRNEGLLSPFFDVQKRLLELKKYYFMYNVPNYTEMVEMVTAHIFKKDEKQKMLDTLNSDFALYLIQNLPENNGIYEKLFKSENNIAVRVLEAAKKYDNLLLKTLASKVKLKEQNRKGWENIPSIKFIQPKDPFALNVMIEHFQALELLDKELYDDLIMASLLQTSLNPSPFSWLSIFPNKGYDIELFARAFSNEHANPFTLDFENYLVAFFFNNPKYIPQSLTRLPDTNWFKQRDMYKKWDREKGMWMIHYGNEFKQPRGTYHLKNYKASKPLHKNKNIANKPTAQKDDSRRIDENVSGSAVKTPVVSENIVDVPGNVFWEMSKIFKPKNTYPFNDVKNWTFLRVETVLDTSEDYYYDLGIFLNSKGEQLEIFFGTNFPPDVIKLMGNKDLLQVYQNAYKNFGKEKVIYSFGKKIKTFPVPKSTLKKWYDIYLKESKQYLSDNTCTISGI